MKHPRGNIGAIVGVNMRLLMAVLSAIIAKAVWPTTPEWWGMAVVSVMFGAAAMAGVAGALGGMIGLYRRERELANYMAQGGAPKSAKLADADRLRKAGMVE